MALLYEIAKKIAPTEVQSVILNELIKEDGLFSLLPFRTLGAQKLQYNRLKSLPTANFVGPYGSVGEGATSWVEATANLTRIADDVKLDNLITAVTSSQVDQLKVQIMGRIQSLANLYKQTFITGSALSFSAISNTTGVTIVSVSSQNDQLTLQDSTAAGTGTVTFTKASNTLQWTAPGDSIGAGVIVAANSTVTLRSSNTNKFITVYVAFASLPAGNTTDTITLTRTYAFDGLATLCATNQNVFAGATSAVKAALTLDKLTSLVNKVKGRKAAFIAMTTGASEKYEKLIRAASGGITPNMVTLGGIEYMAYKGIPILINDYIPEDETIGADTATTSIYAGYFGSPIPEKAEALDQQGGLVGLIPAVDLASEANVETPKGGIAIELFKKLETEDSSKARVKWYTGLALYSTISLARLRGVDLNA